MKGDQEIIDALNECLAGELTAVNQYWIHARMCDNWGYKHLWRFLKGESIGEMKHADMLIERILFLDGVPNMQRYFNVNIGETVEEQFTVDLALEKGHRERVANAIMLCHQKNDPQSRRVLEIILEDTEHHIDWIEAQQDQVAQMGIQNYLAAQILERDAAEYEH